MTFNIIKRVVAVIFLLCMFLPLSRCEMDKLSSPSAPQTQGTDTRARDKTYSSDFTPIKIVEFTDISTWLFIFPFIWPLPLNLLQQRIRKNRVQWTLRLLELALIAYSLYLTYFWATLGTTLLGGYIALACIISYALIFFTENVALLRGKKKPLKDAS